MFARSSTPRSCSRPMRPKADPLGQTRGFAAGITTVERVRQRFVEEGFASALSPYRGGTRVYERKLDGAQEAHLIALACSAPPDERARWTLRLLAQRMVELAYVDTLSYETVRQTLKKER